MPKILEIEINRNVNCSKAVAFWNYWDTEHLDVIHKGYKKSDIMYDKKNFLFRVDEIQIPVFSFLNFKTPVFDVQHDDDTCITFAIQLGIISKTTITIKEIEKKSCSITMNYKFYLEGWRRILEPILRILIPKWNKQVWIEDLPVKLRRQKVVDMNFKDFIGLPDKITDRVYNGDYDFTLPIPRPKNSSRDQHPLSKNN